MESYRWSPTATKACADAATSCVPVASLQGVRVSVFAQDDALGPEHHYVRVDLAFLDASGAVVAEAGTSCPLRSLTVPAGAATLRVHIVPPAAEDLASGACGVPMRGGIVVFW
ncbi:MAG TPA: hypothetical protein VNX21_07590, partial [Candidatus Thermoplasmatota archaeon]|nr:hypothetical protein [Candidatus Thermoplasmatota archaeon]